MESGLKVHKTSINLPERLHREMRVWAAYLDQSWGEFATDALRKYLKKLEKESRYGPTQREQEQA